MFACEVYEELAVWGQIAFRINTNIQHGSSKYGVRSSIQRASIMRGSLHRRDSD